MSTSASEPTTLTATYLSPTNDSFTHTHPLQTPPSTSAEDRVAYLSSLKTAVAKLQERVNKELTERMEDDKGKDSGSAGGKGVVDEKKEEENYGEEIVEEE